LLLLLFSYSDIPIPLGAWTALGSRLDSSQSDEVLNLVSTTLCNYTAIDENREFLDQETLIRTMIELCKKTQNLDIKINICGILANLGSEGYSSLFPFSFSFSFSFSLF
jgi:hypothetical protein